MILLLGVTSHSLTGYAFAQDVKSQAKPVDDSSKAKSNPPHIMTKVEKQKENREKQTAVDATKTAKDKAKADTFTKSSKTNANTHTAKDKASVKSKKG